MQTSNKRLLALLDMPDATFAAFLVSKARSATPLGSIWHDPVLGDDLMDKAYKALNQWQQSKEGAVYVAITPTALGLVKIGFTRKGIDHRKKTLNTAGVVGDMLIIDHSMVHDAPYVEKAVHSIFADKRVSKEFFEIKWETASQAIKAAGDRDRLVLQQYLELPDLFNAKAEAESLPQGAGGRRSEL